MYIWTWVCVHIITLHSVNMKEPRSSNTPEAMRTPGTQILVSKHRCSIKGIRASGEVVSSRLEQEKKKHTHTQGKSATYCNAIK